MSAMTISWTTEDNRLNAHAHAGGATYLCGSVRTPDNGETVSPLNVEPCSGCVQKITAIFG